jgi:hypothetical protein
MAGCSCVRDKSWEGHSSGLRLFWISTKNRGSAAQPSGVVCAGKKLLADVGPKLGCCCVLYRILGATTKAARQQRAGFDCAEWSVMTVDGGGETGDGRKGSRRSWWNLRRFEALTGRMDAGMQEGGARPRCKSRQGRRPNMGWVRVGLESLVELQPRHWICGGDGCNRSNGGGKEGFGRMRVMSDGPSQFLLRHPLSSSFSSSGKFGSSAGEWSPVLRRRHSTQ